MKRILTNTVLLTFSLCWCYPQVPGDGLVSYFPFNGNVEDKEDRAIITTVHGTILTGDRFGAAGNAVLFDGIDDYIEIGNFNELNQDNRICFSLWAQALVNTSNCMLMLYPDDNSDRCVTCAQYKGSIFWDYGNIFENGRMHIGDIPFDSLWHHYVYQIDASMGVKEVYMDGVLLKSESDSSVLTNMDRSL